MSGRRIVCSDGSANEVQSECGSEPWASREAPSLSQLGRNDQSALM